MNILRNTPIFVVAYLLLMMPTYILPYFGSNSSLINALGAGLGLGFSPQWWAHVWSLVMLALIAWVRGCWIKKGYLTIFPVMAGVFDIFPILSVIPLVPTVMHIMAIVVGVKVDGETEPDAGEGAAKKALIGAGAMTLAAVAGVMMFFTSAHKKASELDATHKPATSALVTESANVLKRNEPVQQAPSPPMIEKSVLTKVEDEPIEQPISSTQQTGTSTSVGYIPSPAMRNKTPVATAHSAEKSRVEYTTLDKANAEIDRVINSNR